MKVRAGFTLVELVAVILILGMAAAIATPALLRDHTHGGAEGVAREIGEQLRRAQLAALRSSRPVIVALDTETGQLRADRVEADQTVSLFQERIELPPGVRIGNGRRLIELRLDPIGRALGGSIGVMSGSESVVLQIDPLTGRFEVKAPDAARLQSS